MPSLTRSARSRSARSSSIRSRRLSYRDAAQQTSESRSSSRRRPASPNNRRPPSPSPTRPSATHPDRKRFGLHVHDNQPRISKFDFEERYPEDPIYEELGPNARVWRVNLDECEVYDNDMVIEARDGLDLLLVFAGLFSAVLTTFVAQTSQALSNNFPAVSTSLLLEMVTLQRALINGTPIDGISSSEMTSGPSGFDIWVNALWFTSLTLSLGTALMAVLVKQWLYQYMSIVSGTARDRSLIRFYRFDGLRKWHVLTIIGTLPIVLHIALGLFLAGLVVFLIPLNIPLAGIIGFITVGIYTLYTVSNILPILHTQCPYRTPFSDILNVLMRPILTLLSSVSSSSPAQALLTFFMSAIASAVHLYRLSLITISDLFPTSPSDPSTSPKFPTLKDAERIAATGEEVVEGIACDALLWLYQMTSNPPTKSIVLQSLGCLSDDVSDRLATVNTDLGKALEEVVYEPYFWSIRLGLGSRAERLLRAQRHNKEPQEARAHWEADAKAFKPPFHILAAILTYASTNIVTSRGRESRNWSPYDLLMHIIQEHSAGHLILLPSTLWQQFMTVIRRNFRLEDTDNNIRLCRLALQSLDNDELTPPSFCGGVPITHDTVPLKRVVTDVLPQLPNDLPDSEPLRQLCIINDYIVSELLSNRNLITGDTISTLLGIWARIPDDSTSGGSPVIRRRAEKCIVGIFAEDWWLDKLSVTDSQVLSWCYNSVVKRYWLNRCGNVPTPEMFTKLFSELCWSALVADTCGDTISRILELPFTLDIDNTTAYYTLFCAESPIFSPLTKITLHVASAFSCVMAAFVNGLDRGYHPQALTHQCMESLCAEPDRLFTFCRLLALEKVYTLGPFPLVVDMDATKEAVANSLLKLARLAPQRDAWQQRTHYLVGIEPWDWPYISIPYNHEDIGTVRDMMQFALEVLDHFFSSLNDPPSLPPALLPSEPKTRPIVRQDSQPEPPMVVSPWMRVRQLVFSARAFGRSSSSPVDVELAGLSNAGPSRMSAGESHHTFATIEPANATAGDGSMV